jgi:HSP20 family protein
MAAITRYPQPREVLPLGEAMDRLVREAFTWPRFFGAGVPTLFGLASNLYETTDSYILQVALPGVKVEKLEITARENMLTVHGMTEVAMPQDAQSIWAGMASGEFREEFTLPGEVDAEKASAEYHDGILTLTLPKAEQAKVKTIKVGTYA